MRLGASGIVAALLARASRAVTPAPTPAVAAPAATVFELPPIQKGQVWGATWSKTAIVANGNAITLTASSVNVPFQVRAVTPAVFQQWKDCMPQTLPEGVSAAAGAPGPSMFGMKSIYTETGTTAWESCVANLQMMSLVVNFAALTSPQTKTVSVTSGAGTGVYFIVSSDYDFSAANKAAWLSVAGFTATVGTQSVPVPATWKFSAKWNQYPTFFSGSFLKKIITGTFQPTFTSKSGKVFVKWYTQAQIDSATAPHCEAWTSELCGNIITQTSAYTGASTCYEPDAFDLSFGLGYKADVTSGMVVSATGVTSLSNLQGQEGLYFSVTNQGPGSVFLTDTNTYVTTAQVTPKGQQVVQVVKPVRSTCVPTIQTKLGVTNPQLVTGAVLGSIFGFFFISGLLYAYVALKDEFLKVWHGMNASGMPDDKV